MDLVIKNLIEKEKERQQYHLEMIATKLQEDVMNAQGSILTNKYAEGLPGKRYYGG